MSKSAQVPCESMVRNLQRELENSRMRIAEANARRVAAAREIEEQQARFDRALESLGCLALRRAPGE